MYSKAGGSSLRSSSWMALTPVDEIWRRSSALQVSDC